MKRKKCFKIDLDVENCKTMMNEIKGHQKNPMFMG
jgi:hypothetical protein